MKKYQTQSLYEASYLLSSGFQIVSKDSSGQKTYLVFEDTPELQKALMGFYNCSAEVPAKPLFDAYRSLKDMVFQR